MLDSVISRGYKNKFYLLCMQASNAGVSGWMVFLQVVIQKPTFLLSWVSKIFNMSPNMTLGIHDINSDRIGKNWEMCLGMSLDQVGSGVHLCIHDFFDYRSIV